MWFNLIFLSTEILDMKLNICIVLKKVDSAWFSIAIILTLSTLSSWVELVHLWIMAYSSLIIDVSAQNPNRKANSKNLDETARYEPVHLELHCLQKYLFLVYRGERFNEKKMAKVPAKLNSFSRQVTLRNWNGIVVWSGQGSGKYICSWTFLIARQKGMLSWQSLLVLRWRK